MFLVMVITVAAIALATFLVNISWVSFASSLILLSVPFFVTHPKAYFLVFMFTRPSMDLFAKYSIGGANVAAVSSIIFIGICGALLCKREHIRSIRENRPLITFNFLFLCFLSVCFLTLLNSSDKSIFLIDMLRLLTLIVAVNYAVVHFKGAQKAKTLFYALLGSGIVPLLLGLYQWVAKKGMAELGYNRLAGTFLHTNVFSEYLLWLFFTGLCFLSTYSMGKRSRSILYALLGLVLLEMFLTYTRSVWIAFAVSIFAFVFFRNKFISKLKFILIVLLLGALLSPHVIKRFSDINESAYYQLSSWQWRLQMWGRVTDNLKEHPFIGHGLGMFEPTFGMMAHNDYLRIAFETGIIGLLFYVSVLLYILVSNLRIVFSSKNIHQIIRAKIAALCLALSFIIMSSADNMARSTVILVNFFVVMVYLLAYDEGVPLNK